MASSRPSTDITETVCQCPVCSDQLKDPKLLPCLHRYCRDCLTSVIQSARERMFKCSVCKQDCKILENEVDGFETDLHMTSRLLLIKFQDSFVKKDQKHLCGNCSNESTTPTYCFKCDSLSCRQCFDSHRTDEQFQDHLPHTLNMKPIQENFTLDPMCAKHMSKRAQSLCITCGDGPICMKCTNKHREKGHKVHDVVQLAESERKLLKAISLDFDKLTKLLYAIPSLLNPKMLQIQIKLTKNDVKREEMLKDLKTNKEEAKNELRIKYERDLAKLEQKFDQESKEAREKHDEIKAVHQKELEDIEKTVQELPATRQVVDERRGSFHISKQLIERNKNVKATYSSILDSKDLWSDAQCIPYIRKAIESFTKDMDQAFSQFKRKFQPNGTFKCDASECSLCENNQIVESFVFTSNTNKVTYNITSHIRCNTENVIYLISCDICGKQYVGKTKRPLNVRFDEHVTDVKMNENPTEIVAHFNSNNRSEKDMKLQGIKCLSSDENLLKEEKKWIIKLGTLVPDGLNMKY